MAEIVAWLPDRIREEVLRQVQGLAPKFAGLKKKAESVEAGTVTKAQVLDAITTVEALRRTLRDERQRRAIMRVHAVLTAVSKTL